jgi:methionyl-tRNA formyltransferase
VTARSWRVVYFGTPEVAVAPLQALCRAGHDVALVVTRPPKRRGRRQEPTPSPVEQAAAELGLDVSYDLADAVEVEAHLGVVVAYGEHIPDELLERRRTVNLHFSRLPRWRGAAPVERAIMAGDTDTGVCLMDVASELDAGDVYLSASTAIAPDETVDDLRSRLCDLGIELLLEAMTEGFAEPVPQAGDVSWANKISSAELRIDWSGPGEHGLRLVRVGGAWTIFRGRRLKVLEAQPVAGGDTSAAPGTISLEPRSAGGSAVTVATGRGVVELVTVQSEGRDAVGARGWANGARIAGGERFDE